MSKFIYNEDGDALSTGDLTPSPVMRRQMERIVESIEHQKLLQADKSQLEAFNVTISTVAVEFNLLSEEGLIPSWLVAIVADDLDVKPSLKNLMTILESKATVMLTDGLDHCQVCNALASEFRLWESTGEAEFFPAWLSRVVEGIMNDLKES